MSEYIFTENELNDLREVFFSEAYEILQELDQEVLNLESGKDRAAALRNIQRHFHTLKGNSRALGFSGLNTLAHKAEDLLKIIHDSGMETDQNLIDLLFEVNDQLQALVHGHRSKIEVPLDNRLMDRIESALNSAESCVVARETVSEGADNSTNIAVYDIVVVFDQNCRNRSEQGDCIIDKLGSAGEVLTVEPDPRTESEPAGKFRVRLASAQPAELLKELAAVPEAVHAVEISVHGNGHKSAVTERQTAPAGDSAVQTVRVDSVRIDKILNLVGELVIGRSMVGQVLSQITERYKKDDLMKKLDHANSFMEKTLSQLQKNVMKIRMHPISQIFRKFPRVVRDLSVEQQKQVELIMEGEKTELDKGILEVVGEPLIHLVRNAVDHGIEPPEIREQSGKPRLGTITLRAKHEGNQIVIDVVDDGKGLDPELFRKKAVEKGIKTEEEAARLSEAEALDLMFLSGFSTSEVVTDISGRGFGMDIVRATVESLKGRIQVTSKPGHGATFTLRLPLTLAIIRAMLFSVNDRLFALPLSSIEKISRLRDSDIQPMAGKNVLRYRDKIISIISLNEVLKIQSRQTGTCFKKYVIIVSLGGNLYGFAVDRLIGQQELVIKALDNHWGTANCTSGASLLGNGKVVLILDAPAIIMKGARREFIRA